MIRKQLLLALTLLLALGCDFGSSKGTDTGNGFRVGLTAAGGQDVAYEAADAQGTKFTVRTAKANVASILLFLPGGIECDDIEPHEQATCNPSRYEITGPFEIDLVTMTANPPIEAPIPVGTYKQVEVRFVSGGTLGDRTLVGSGVFDDNGTETGFDFAFGFNATSRFESEDGVIIQPEHELLALLDVSTWLSAAPITDCLQVGDVDVTDGRLQLADGRGQCRALENDIVEAVKKSGRLDRR